jgi:hypothetical protein
MNRALRAENLDAILDVQAVSQPTRRFPRRGAGVAEQGCLLISKDAETKDLLHLPAFTTIHQKSPACNQLNSKCCQFAYASGSDEIRDNNWRQNRD